MTYVTVDVDTDDSINSVTITGRDIIKIAAESADVTVTKL